MVRIFIENQELDVKDDFSHQITYAVDDLKNLDSKSTAFSKTIVLPGTANNNRLLGNIFEFSNSNYNTAGNNVGYNFNAAKSAKTRLEVNGLTVIKGVMRLLEIVIDDKTIEYEVAIFGELGGFFNKLGTSKIEDLDFSQYDHTYNVTNIKSSWSITKDFIRNNPGANTTFSANYVKIVGYNFQNVEPGDTINIYVASPTSNNGDYTVQNVYYDVENNTTYIYMTTNFPSAFTGVLTVTITLKNKRGIGYYYPLIDYGNVSTGKKNYQFKAFRPAIFVKEIITKIIKNAGYSYDSNFFKTDFFTRLIIPNNQKDLQSYKTRVFYGYDVNFPAAESTSFDLVINGYVINSITTTDNSIFTYTGSNGTFDLSFISTLNLKLFNSLDKTIGFKFAVYKNGSLFYSDPDFTYRNFTFKNTTTDIADISINLPIQISLNTNDTFQFKLLIDSSNSLSAYSEATTITLDAVKPVIATVNYGDTISLNTVIPLNILQKDFFASILKMFNLMVVEDKYTDKKLIIEPWVDFYDLDRSTYLDWSDKIDRSNVIKIKPMSEINARYYQIKYKSDNDYYNELYKKKYNEGYGDVNFDNALEFAKDSSTTEVIFSATPLVGWSGEDKVVPAIMKWDGVTKGVNEESVTSNIRIMQAKEVTGVTSWNITDVSGGTLASGTTYGYAGHLDNPDAPAADLNFGSTKELYFTLVAGALQNNLFNTYYSSYMAEITDKDSRLVTAKIKLTEQDIYNLDFGRFIFFDGVLYRLQRIVDYSAGDICTVELLRVIYTQY
jgi:hypothetical protein